ncbi:MAG: hypothetical protein KBT02_04005 [Treponema sp.]|nr:hypothetical protein [Candidatus Treponema caballi]
MFRVRSRSASSFACAHCGGRLRRPAQRYCGIFSSFALKLMKRGVPIPSNWMTNAFFSFG